MPIYEYKCEDCEYSFGVKRSISEMDNVTACPSCGSVSPQRKFSTSSTFLSTDKNRSVSNINNSTGSTGILMENGSGVALDNVEFRNLDTAIKAKRASIRGKKVRMKGNRTGFDTEDTDIHMNDLTIK